MFCPNCGKENKDGTKFCLHCGNSLQAQETSQNYVKKDNSAEQVKTTQVAVAVKPKKKKKTVLIIIIVVVVAVAIALGVIFIPELLKKPEDYMAEGNFEKAYSIAQEGEEAEAETEAVCRENCIAVCSAKCADGLKDSKSFELKEAWWTSTTVVLRVSAKNSYGATISSYFCYFYDTDDGWYCYNEYSSLEEKEVYSWDSKAEIAEKYRYNEGVYVVKAVITSISNSTSERNKLSDEGVDRINKLFEDDSLDKVDLLDESISLIKSYFD